MDPSDWFVFGTGIYVDGNGWQPWQDAFNVAPIFGSVAIGFGIVNIIQGKDVAGWIQIGMGIAAVVLGIAIN